MRKYGAHTEFMQPHTKIDVKVQQYQLERDLFLALLICSFVLLFMHNAHATMTPMGAVLCNIVGIVYGNLGKGLACIAVITVGVGALLGKASWGLALTVAVGIAAIFGADDIVGYLGVDMSTTYCWAF